MPDYFDLDVSLRGTEPPVWRRFLLQHDATFADLHEAIQDAMGWQNYHLWQFQDPGAAGHVVTGPVEAFEGLDTPPPAASTLKVSAFFGAPGGRSACLYLYDFGDQWEHDVRLRGIVTAAESFERRLSDGARACPPEDCGGPPGYADAVRLIRRGRRARTEDEEDLLETFRDWQPDAFLLPRAQAAFNR